MHVPRRLTGAVAALAAAALLLPLSGPAQAAQDEGIHVQDGRIYEADGTELVLRGVNHAHTWYAGQTQSFADIASLGANSVRTVLSSGDRWTRNDTADVANVIRLAKEAELISVLEVHDTTGYGEQAGAATLDDAVDYWISVKEALVGQEDYVLVNIGNEPYGNDASVNASYAADTMAAITRLRDAGLTHTIVVDAPAWGQDWAGLMRDSAAQIYAADPLGDTVFSVHMYGVYAQGSTVTAYLEAFRSKNLPLVVGEFGDYHSDGDVDEDTILAETDRLDIGYLGWSWSGNGGGVEYLDLATGFDKDALSPWGERLFNGPDGIRATSTTASIFGGTTPDPEPTPTPTDPPTDPPTEPPAGACTATHSTVGAWQGGFQGQVTVTAGTAAISGWTVSWTYPSGTSVTQSWGGRATVAGSSVTARNEAWNGSLSAGGSTTLGFIGSGAAPSTAPQVTCSAS